MAVTTAPPELLTERLRLTLPDGQDFTASLAMWSSPDVVRFIGGRPSTGEEVWARLLRYAGSWSLLGFGYWVVRERSSGAHVGEVGFADLRRDIEPGLGTIPELGWALVPQAWGRGYAREAIGAAIGWMDDTRHNGTIACIIAPENLRSVRVAESFGFRLQAQASYKGTSTLIYRRTKSPKEQAWPGSSA